MLLKSKNGLTFLQFPHMAGHSQWRHAIFTRAGGCSPPPFESLNIGFKVNDKRRNVQQNRQKILELMELETMVAVDQVHGAKIVRWTSTETCSRRVRPLLDDRTINLGRADAVITNLADQPLLIQTADCQAILLADPVRKVVGNVHSGWRGSLQNIAGQTVAMMQEHYHCNPTDILAGIGPSLGPCCAEFINYQKEIPEAFWPYRLKNNHFDFWAVSRDQLIEAGIKTSNIVISGFCTSCRTDLFFSYRKEKQTGRFGALISILE